MFPVLADTLPFPVSIEVVCELYLRAHRGRKSYRFAVAICHSSVKVFPVLAAILPFPVVDP